MQKAFAITKQGLVVLKEQITIKKSKLPKSKVLIIYNPHNPTHRKIIIATIIRSLKSI